MACNVSPPIFFLLVSSLLSLSCVMAQDALNKVCAKTINPGVCFSVLRSDRRSATVDYTGLGYIAIDLGTSSITSTYNKLMVLDRVTRNPGFKEHLGFCIQEFESVVDSCSDAREFSTKKAYKGMYIAGNSIAEAAKLGSKQSSRITHPQLPITIGIQKFLLASLGLSLFSLKQVDCRSPIYPI
ncbi:hypothetical protein Vadar_033001 [Vaccinium darrowii]|uniref:Uncharacterized protein n=1 Tax=Vaccinium darrowii TaxID=229202 RepID=A0ACB7XVT7_9ERIC|nr:hypothetical protein Vadar_033001 [Vaccinium darrowii]